MYQSGEVSISECNECGEVFPIFTFVADTDMVTNGCVALTGADNSIVLTMSRANESISDIENRIGSNHKIVRATYVNEPANNRVSFQEFRKTYKPAKPIYTCISCGGKSTVIKHQTKEQFLTYGKIQVINDC
ncbi:hypothetical protein [Psychromonas sp. SP041]|uniref:hypothetical protein n=1 Tax=Psychromonas sp. SP041 TaxID=1365007 RepID=UPI00046ED7A8|nr:hypothetical protein [Psychromonas sp. SP041]